MPIASFYIDRYPVTNAEFRKFIDAAKYHPADGHNLLKDWRNGTFPPGWDNKPVTWVSLEHARAYAQWAGKRLPHEWEWQYAAQGRTKCVWKGRVHSARASSDWTCGSAWSWIGSSSRTSTASRPTCHGRV